MPRYERGNIAVTFDDEQGCWVEMWGDNGEEQSMALESNEMLLLYMALGDHYEGRR